MYINYFMSKYASFYVVAYQPQTVHDNSIMYILTIVDTINNCKYKEPICGVGDPSLCLHNLRHLNYSTSAQHHS